MKMRMNFPRCFLTVLNQLYELERKVKRHDDPTGLSRHVGKIRDAFYEEGFPNGDHSCTRLAYEDPMGQPFNETRTDLDATIAGSGTEDLVVVEVIKPIIRVIVSGGACDSSTIVQQGVVVVESRKEQ